MTIVYEKNTLEGVLNTMSACMKSRDKKWRCRDYTAIFAYAIVGLLLTSCSPYLAVCVSFTRCEDKGILSNVVCFVNTI